MAKKKNVKSEDIISMYMNYVLEHNQEPTTVYKFCKDNNFDEALFYTNFASFHALKASVFKVFFQKAMTLLLKSDDFSNFDARNKLLSFYFTFFELLTANRSYVVFALGSLKHNLENIKSLKLLRTSFKNFIDELEIETIETRFDKFDNLQKKAISESAWLQFLLTMKFWLEDTSASFEKTDIFIEKSVNASFDVLSIVPIQSVLDLGKFLFKEKIKR